MENAIPYLLKELFGYSHGVDKNTTDKKEQVTFDIKQGLRFHIL